MSRQKLATGAGVSLSYINEVVAGKANPSIKLMDRISTALDVPLPLMLERAPDQSEIPAVHDDPASYTPVLLDLPDSYVRIYAIVKDFQAFQIRKWDAEARSELYSGNHE